MTEKATRILHKTRVCGTRPKKKSRERTRANKRTTFDPELSGAFASFNVNAQSSSKKQAKPNDELLKTRPTPEGKQQLSSKEAELPKATRK